MSENQNWSNIGDQFKGTLSDALQSGDFKELNDLIANTVNGALKEAIQSGRSAVDSLANGARNDNVPTWQIRANQRAAEKQNKINQDWQNMMQKRQMAQQQAQFNSLQQQVRVQVPSLNNNYNGTVKVRKVGSVSSVLLKVFGGIGMGVFGILALAVGLSVMLLESMAAPLVVFLLLTSASWLMVDQGIRQSNRLKRADRYTRLCLGRMYGEIRHLAANTGKSEKFVLRDLQKMLDLGMFPEGHLDAGGTCFMLNDTIYRQYLDAENGRRARELEEQRNLLEQKSEPITPGRIISEAEREQEAELNAMMTEGMEYIRRVRELNDRIPGEPISGKLYQMENLLKEIFNRVREHPEQRHRIHKLQEYYLPTTLKLVEAYADFDSVSTPGMDILSAKAEIEKTLDTINQAYTEILNNLFKDAAFDVTTDAQVLQTMLAKEGLTRQMDFVPRSNGNEKQITYKTMEETSNE